MNCIRMPKNSAAMTVASLLVLAVSASSIAHAQDASNPNLALHKTYAVSNPNAHNYGIGGLTDGSWAVSNDNVFATNDDDTFPKTATIDLGQLSSVSAVVVGIPPIGSTKTVEVSVSADGASYSPGGSFVFDQGKEERHIYTFASTSARYIRLTYLDHYNTQIGYSPLFAFTEECEVYAKDPGTAYLATLPTAAVSVAAATPAPLRSLGTPPNPLDLAYGKSFVSSDPNQYGWGSTQLTDGSWGADQSHCFATGMSPTFPKTATIDLGDSKSVSAVVLGVPPFGSTKTVGVSISTNGTDFTSIGSHVFDQSKEEKSTYAFPSAVARYVRLTYVDYYDSMVQFPQTYAFTEECEVYAKASNAPK